MNPAWPRVMTATMVALLMVQSLGALAQEDAAPQPVKLKKSTPASQRVYNAAAGVHNFGNYEVASKQWAKFLEQYPDDELAPKAQHYLGICYMQLKPPKYADAATAYQTVLTKYPGFAELHDTLLNLGWCQYQLGLGGDKKRFAAADKTFAQLIEKEKYVDQALYFQGESRYMQGDRKGAVAAYSQLVEEHPDSTSHSDALYALGVAQEELGQYVDAGKTYDAFLEKYGEEENLAQLLTEIRMRKAETILQAGVKLEEDKQADKAKPLFAQAEKMFAAAAAVEGFPSADHATFRQAFCAARQGKYAEAGALYAKVADNPKSVYIKEATMDAGRSFYQADNTDAAETRFRKVVELGGADVPEAAHWLCRILIDQKKQFPEAAALAAKTIPTADKSSFLVNLKMDEADAKFETPQTRPESLALFAAIAKDHPDDPQAAQALYNAAFTALQLKQYDDALAHATAFLAKYESHKLSPDVKYVSAESNLFLKKYPEAEKLYADLAANHKGHQDMEQWQLRLGLTQYLQNKYKEAADTLTPAVSTFKSKDNIAEAQYYIGGSNYRLKKYGEAAAAFDASYAANPKWRRSDEVLLDLARAQEKAEKLNDAIAATKKMLAEFPKSDLLDRAHFQLAQYSYDAKDYKTSTAEYAAVVENWPNSIFTPHSLYGKGWSEHRAGDNKAAIASFTALIDNHKDHKLVPESLHGRGICRQASGEFAGGAADFTAYLATNPDETAKCEARFSLGLCQAGLKKFSDATKTYESILAECADYPEKDKVRYELAWAYQSQEKKKEAIEQFAQLVADYPESKFAAEAFYYVGEDQYDSKKYAEAAKSYEASKAKAGKNELGERAIHKLGWANYRLGKYEEGLAVFDEQLKTYPQGKFLGDALFMQGECQFKLKNYAAAMAAFEKALAANPSSDVMKVLSMLHGGQSATQLEEPNWEKAVELLAPIPENHAESGYLADALYELGWANFNLGKQDEAVKYWNEVTIKGSDALAARSRFMIGETKFAKKNFSGAIEDYLLVITNFGADAAPKPVRPWQAKACLQAGQCAAILAGEAKDKTKRDSYLADAKKYLNRAVEKYSDEEMIAKSAAKQLERLGGGN